MIEQEARVVAVADGMAEIVTRRQSACGSCEARNGCGTSLVAAWFPQRRMTLRLHNTIGAQVGDSVVVGLDESALQRGSLVLYALPLAGLLAGALGGEELFAALGLGAELGAVLFGLMGLTVALVYIRMAGSGPDARGDAGVKLLRVVHRKPTIAPGQLVLPVTRQAQEFRK